MAYIDKNLHKLTELGEGNSMWCYHTLDAAATVDTAAYFTGEALTKLRKGDVIMRITWATAITTGTVSTYGWHIVLTNTGTAINVTDALAGTVTDSD